MVIVNYEPMNYGAWVCYSAGSSITSFNVYNISWHQDLLPFITNKGVHLFYGKTFPRFCELHGDPVTFKTPEDFSDIVPFPVAHYN